MKYVTLCVLLLCCYLHGLAGDVEKEAEAQTRHKIAPMMGYTYVFDAIDSEFGTTQANRLIPTLGLDYTFAFTPKFSAGLFNDIELGTYTISSINNGERLIRERVFVTALVGIYEIYDRLSLLAGAGAEFEHHKNFFVLRMGAEYEVAINHTWDLGFGFTYDYKEDYSALGIGVSFGKSF